MERILQCFSVNFSFPIYFTRDLFVEENPLFLEAVSRIEPDRRHRVFFVIDDNVAKAHSELIAQIRRYFHANAERLELLDEPLLVLGGEEIKNDLAPTLELVRRVNELGIDRQSCLAVIGGGAVLDMASFAASISHRGIRTIRVPTTVLSQADSGVGVKSGINLFGKKNFIGTFAPPFAVLNDFSFLKTLSHRDKIAGIAESVKVALIRDRAFVEFLEDNVSRLAAAEPQLIERQIRRSAQHHIEHIRGCGDPFEFGSARPLDFGHWSAHKLESMTEHRLRHGEAVALGIALDSVYSAQAGYLPVDGLKRILELLTGLRLPVWDDAFLQRTSTAEYVLLQGLQEFREHLGGILHISLLRDIGEGFEVNAIDDRLMIDSIHFLKKHYSG